jgi:hypothetical protein
VSAEHDPPRLRALVGELPPALSAALRGSPAEEATAAELEQVRLAVSDRLRVSSALRPRRRPAVARALTLAMTFAVGAGAGVLVSGGIFFAQRGMEGKRSESERTPRAPDGAERSGGAPAAATSPEPEAGPSATSASPAPPAVPTGGRARRTTNGAAALPEPNAAPSPAPLAAPSASPDELKLLARAQRALSSDPSSALALAGEHVRSFPSGALVQEREMIAIDALLRLERAAEASLRAARFHQRFPSSAHRRRVDVLFELRGLSKP